MITEDAGCDHPMNFVQNECLWEVNPTGGEAGTPNADYSTNYVGDDVSLNDVDVFLESQTEEAQTYYEHGGLPKIFSYQNCIWQDSIYHSIKNIIVQADYSCVFAPYYQCDDAWEDIGQLSPIGADREKHRIDIKVTDRMRAAYKSFQQLPFRIKFVFNDDPLPTFAGDCNFMMELKRPNPTSASAPYIDMINPAPELITDFDVAVNNVLTIEGRLHISQDWAFKDWDSPKYEDSFDLKIWLYIQSEASVTGSGKYYEIGNAFNGLIKEMRFYREAPTPDMLMVGDIDGDGAITVQDLVLLSDCILSGGNLDVFDENVIANGDINGDGSVDVNDLIMLMDIILTESGPGGVG